MKLLRKNAFTRDISVLLAVKLDKIQTRVMYRCNLSWDAMQRSLDGLTRRGYVTRAADGRSRTLTLTPSGNDALKSALHLIDLLGYHPSSFVLGDWDNDVLLEQLERRNR